MKKYLFLILICQIIVTLLTSPRAHADNCSAFSYTYNSSRNRCEAPPFCNGADTFSTTRDRCETGAGANCPSTYTYSAPYCQGAPTCTTGGSFVLADHQCEAAQTQTCPYGTQYPCTSGNCTPTVNCNQQTYTEYITGGIKPARSTTTQSTVTASGNIMTFVDTYNHSTWKVNFTYCTWTQSWTGTLNSTLCVWAVDAANNRLVLCKVNS